MNYDKSRHEGDGDSGHSGMEVLDFGLDMSCKFPLVYSDARARQNTTDGEKAVISSSLDQIQNGGITDMVTFEDLEGVVDVIDFDTGLRVCEADEEITENDPFHFSSTARPPDVFMKRIDATERRERLFSKLRKAGMAAVTESQGSSSDVVSVLDLADVQGGADVVEFFTRDKMSELLDLDSVAGSVNSKKKSEVEELIRILDRALNIPKGHNLQPNRVKSQIKPILMSKPMLTKMKSNGNLYDEERNNPGCSTSSISLFHNSPFYDLLDTHRTPFVCDIDYADSLLSDEIYHLKKEAGMTNVAVKLETQYSHIMRHSTKQCPVCGNESTLTCKNCLDIAYCSREHQKKHWKDHRPDCMLYEVVQNDWVGRQLVAKINIKPGDLILKEFPLLVGPTGGDSSLMNYKFNVSEILEPNEIDSVRIGQGTMEEMVNVYKDAFDPVCLGCSLELGNMPNPQFCENCGWPLCGNDCVEIQSHKMECIFFKKEGISYDKCSRQYLLPPRIYVVLRFMLMKTAKPSIWHKLMNLKSNVTERRKHERTYGRRLNDLYIAFLVKKVFKFDQVTIEDIQKMLGIMDTNGFYAARFLSLEPGGGKTRKHISLYDKASFLSHSCVPNAIVIRNDPASLEVVAATAMKKGDIIWIDYDYQGFLRPKYERQQLLKLQYFFVCQCPLCCDGTENNQYLSGISCLRCRRRGNEGYMLPINPLSDNPVWKCRKCSCKKSDSNISGVIREVSKNMYECSEVSLRTIIDKFSGVVVHRNHNVILQAQFDIICILYSQVCENVDPLTLEEIQYLSDLIEKRIGIVQKLVPPCHKALINLKLQLVEVMAIQVARIDQNFEAVVVPISQKIQAIHDDMVLLLTENCLKNSMQAFLLYCSRLARNTLHRVHDQLHSRRLYM